ncbi:MAG: MFS transporter [Deltaproteobacteria bacterium]|nr:MFS transporter [Deltaproteobacteria bacterium]
MSTERVNPVVKYFKDFSVLKETRREYWGLQIVNVLDSTAYFAMFNIVILSLSDDFGLDDADAGYAFMVFSSATTIFLFLSGLLTDWLGIKRSLWLSMVGMAVSRAGIVAAVFLPEGTLRTAVAVAGLALMAPFVAMVQTAFQAANKRFTTKRSRGAGFNLWYLFMNVGAALGGFVVDWAFIDFGWPRYHIFTFGILTSLLSIVAIFLTIHHTEQLVGEDEEPEEEEAADAPRQSPIEIAKAVLRESAFWRFTALISLLLGVRAVFLYLGLLHPKFWTRVIGSDAAIGTLQALNPIGVIVGLIVLIPVLERFNVYKMLVTGAFITSVALLLQAVPPFGGLDLATFTYYSAGIFLLVLTVGELIWSPRLQEYTAAIAPKGQEGTYFGLSMVPYFLAKTAIGFVSGHMLAYWCPEGIGDRLRAGEVEYWRTPYAMWLVLALVALGGSLTALLLRGWFTRGTELEKEQSPEDRHAVAPEAA